VKLVVDLGQSGTRYKLNDVETSLKIYKNSFDPLVVTLETIFNEVPKGQYPEVLLSLTGLQGNVGDPAPYGTLCNRIFGANSVCVMDDGIASYVGTLGNRSGVVLTLGGGVVAVSSHGGKFGHADGKGPIFGDFGGGFWLGQTALRLAIATVDGRERFDDLVSLLKNELKDYLNLENKTGIEASALCIATAKTLADGAAAGNTEALEILESGAKYLSKAIYAAWLKVKNDETAIPALAIKGGLSNSQLYVSLIHKFTNEEMQFETVKDASDNLIGAEKAASLFPTDIPPLLKWWRA